MPLPLPLGLVVVVVVARRKKSCNACGLSPAAVSNAFNASGGRLYCAGSINDEEPDDPDPFVFVVVVDVGGGGSEAKAGAGEGRAVKREEEDVVGRYAECA